MTQNELIQLPIEEIIKLPNFISLESVDKAKEFMEKNGLFISPYWRITFKGDLIEGGRMFECFGSKSILPTFTFHKYKDERLNKEETKNSLLR